MKALLKPRHAILGALLLGSALALSATPEAPRVAVHYQDLNLSKPQDAQVLYKRIRHAAIRVCSTPGPQDSQHLSQYSRCYAAAVARAVDSVNQTTLTALHQARTQRARPS